MYTSCILYMCTSDRCSLCIQHVRYVHDMYSECYTLVDYVVICTMVFQRNSVFQVFMHPRQAVHTHTAHVNHYTMPWSVLVHTTLYTASNVRSTYVHTVSTLLLVSPCMSSGVCSHGDVAQTNANRLIQDTSLQHTHPRTSPLQNETPSRTHTYTHTQTQTHTETHTETRVRLPSFSMLFQSQISCTIAIDLHCTARPVLGLVPTVLYHVLSHLNSSQKAILSQVFYS